MGTATTPQRRSRSDGKPTTASQRAAAIDHGAATATQCLSGQAEDFPYGVVLYCPTASRPYHRIAYRDPRGKRHEPSAGRDHAKARGKAADVSRELGADLGEHGSRPVSALFAAWQAVQQVENAQSHIDKSKSMGERFIIPQIGAIPTHRLRRAQVQELLKAPTADSARRHLRAAVGAMLAFGHEAGDWGIGPREQYLPRKRRTAKAERGQEHGTSPLFIAERLRPDKHAMKLLADAMRAIGHGTVEEGKPLTAKQIRRGEQLWLMFALAACSGPRQGELFAGTAGQVSRDGKTLRVDRQIVRPAGGGWYLTLPKWGRPRTTFIPEVTWWGEPLREPLLAYLAERGLTAGRLRPIDPAFQSPPPADLLFPAWRGGYWHPSNFDGERVFGAARQLVPEWSPEWTWHAARHAFCSQLLAGDEEVGRKPALPADVMLAAGHKDVSVTLAMYVGPTAGAMDRLNAL